jgi:serine/threonine-protein kinase RsbW
VPDCGVTIESVVITLRVPATLQYRDVATRVVSSACKIVERSTAEFREQVESAFGEAFNNAVLHAYRDMSPGLITVEVLPQADRITVRVLDDGRSFDPATIPAPDLQALPESGMGWYIMRAFMDEVRYEPGPPNVLLLSKAL